MTRTPTDTLTGLSGSVKFKWRDGRTIQNWGTAQEKVGLVPARVRESHFILKPPLNFIEQVTCRPEVLIPPNSVNLGVNQERLSSNKYLQAQLLLLSFNLLALKRTNDKPGNSPRIRWLLEKENDLSISKHLLSSFYIPGAILTT